MLSRVPHLTLLAACALAGCGTLIGIDDLQFDGGSGGSNTAAGGAMSATSSTSVGGASTSGSGSTVGPGGGSSCAAVHPDLLVPGCASIHFVAASATCEAGTLQAWNACRHNGTDFESDLVAQPETDDGLGCLNDVVAPTPPNCGADGDDAYVRVNGCTRSTVHAPISEDEIERLDTDGLSMALVFRIDGAAPANGAFNTLVSFGNDNSCARAALGVRLTRARFGILDEECGPDVDVINSENDYVNGINTSVVSVTPGGAAGRLYHYLNGTIRDQQKSIDEVWSPTAAPNLIIGGLTRKGGDETLPADIFEWHTYLCTLDDSDRQRIQMTLAQRYALP